MDIVRRFRLDEHGSTAAAAPVVASRHASQPKASHKPLKLVKRSRGASSPRPLPSPWPSRPRRAPTAASRSSRSPSHPKLMCPRPVSKDTGARSPVARRPRAKQCSTRRARVPKSPQPVHADPAPPPALTALPCIDPGKICRTGNTARRNARGRSSDGFERHASPARKRAPRAINRRSSPTRPVTGVETAVATVTTVAEAVAEDVIEPAVAPVRPSAPVNHRRPRRPPSRKRARRRASSSRSCSTSGVLSRSAACRRSAATRA